MERFHIQGNLTHTVQKYPKGNNNLNWLLWVEKREHNIIVYACILIY